MLCLHQGAPRSCLSAAGGSSLMEHSTPMPFLSSRAGWRRFGDPGSGWGEGVAGDGRHGHEEGVCLTGLAGAGGSEARSTWRSCLLLPWASRRSAEGDLARRSGGQPVCAQAGEGPVPVAVACRWRCGDHACADGVSAVRHRLAQPGRDLASDGDGLRDFCLEPWGLCLCSEWDVIHSLL